MRSEEIRRLGGDWYRDPEFWHLYAPYIFGPGRWAGTAREADGIVSLLSLREGSRVLDACCGVGRHSVELAKRGCRVTGIDLNEAYLEAAAGTAEAEGVSLRLILRDILELDAVEEYDAAVNLYTSFGYFASRDQDAALLRKLHRSLRPGGRLLVETLGKERLAGHFTESEWYEQNGAFLLAEYTILDDFSRLQNRWIIVDKEKTYDYTFSHRIFSAEELKRLFAEAGFSDIAAFGSFEGARYDNKAETLIVTGTK